MKDSFELVSRQSPIAVGITRLRDGLVLDVNDACCALMGLARDEMVGRDAVAIGAWTTRLERADVMARLRAEGRVRQHETRLANGQHVLLSFESFTLRQDVPCLLVTSSTSPGGERPNHELRESEARWHSSASARATRRSTCISTCRCWSRKSAARWLPLVSLCAR